MTVTTLREIHAAILRAMEDQFGERVETYDAYRVAETGPVNTPALLLDLDLSEDENDCGDGRREETLTWTLYCVLSAKTSYVALEIRELAQAVKEVVRDNQWGLAGAVKFPTALYAGPAAFKPGEEGYAAWFVNWEQVALFGESLWDGSGVFPHEVWLGWDPDIGPAHVDDYVQIASEADLPEDAAP